MIEGDIKQKKSRNFFGFLFDLIFPRNCLSCGQIGNWLCSDCLEGKVYLELSEVDLVFNEAVDRLYFMADFNDSLIAKIVKNCKYQGVRELAELMGDKLATEFREGKKIKQAKIVPVPLHKIRHRTRGFNQAEIIAKKIATELELELVQDLVVRKINSMPQAGLSRADRLTNLHNAFSLSDTTSLQGTNLVVIIDDVITTGSTINEIAKLLKTAGVKEVWGVAFAHGL